MRISEPVSYSVARSVSGDPQFYPSGSVTITGLAIQGQTLTASNTLDDPNGMGVVSYQWKANGVAIATGSSYTLTQAEVGKFITVTASYTDGAGYAHAVDSAPTGAVLPDTVVIIFDQFTVAA